MFEGSRAAPTHPLTHSSASVCTRTHTHSPCFDVVIAPCLQALTRGWRRSITFYTAWCVLRLTCLLPR